MTMQFQYDEEIAMVDSKFTIILDLKIADTDAGYFLQWDTYFFKFAVYQTQNQKIQFIWIDKGSLICNFGISIK